MKLYSYFRSSAAYRVRIALNIKGLSFQQDAIDLLKNGGEQFGADYASINPQRLVPALDDAGFLHTQSLAIMEYLDETYPTPPLLPSDARERSRVRSIAMAIACDIHPLSNLRTLRYLKRELGASSEQRDAWHRHWNMLGMTALEARLSHEVPTGPFCHGDTPTMADCCLVPQIHNARRLDCDLAVFPTLNAIAARCEALPAFAQAAPEAQPDAQ